MNKILVVAKNPKTYFINRLTEEVGKEKILLFNPWSDVLPMDYTHLLCRTSGVYHSEKDLEFLKSCSMPPLNSLQSHLVFRAKSSQYSFFDQQGIPSLPWWWLADWDEQESFSYLVKPDHGQGGWGIRVMNSGELTKWRDDQNKKGDLSWIVQPYVKAPEYRIFFLGQDRFTLKRCPDEKNIASNFAQEGSAELVGLPVHLEAVVEDLISKAGAYYGAIDLLDPPAGAVVLELNVVPGIEQLEKITGENIIQRLLTANYFCQIV